MRNDVFCTDSSRLNAPGGFREGLEGLRLPSNPQIHRIHKEKEKKNQKKKEKGYCYYYFCIKDRELQLSPERNNN